MYFPKTVLFFVLFFICSFSACDALKLFPHQKEDLWYVHRDVKIGYHPHHPLSLDCDWKQVSGFDCMLVPVDGNEMLVDALVLGPSDIHHSFYVGPSLSSPFFISSRAEGDAYPREISGRIDSEGVCGVCRRVSLWRALLEKYLIPPSIKLYSESIRTLKDGHDATQYGQKENIRSIHWHSKSPFYVEVGAFNGLSLSNSIDLELHGWSGLLIEGNSQLSDQIQKLNRKAWILPAALSPKPFPTRLDFRLADTLGGLVELFYSNHRTRLQRENSSTKTDLTDCFPLADVMTALKQNTIDFWSLDIEGGEKGVLSSLNFSNPFLKFGVIAMEADYVDPERTALLSPFFDLWKRFKGDEWWIAKDYESILSLPGVIG